MPFGSEPHPDIRRQLQEGDNPFAENPSMPSPLFVKEMAESLFADIVNKIRHYTGKDQVHFEEIIPLSFQAITRVMGIEGAHHRTLENLALRLIREEFGVDPEEVGFEAHLTRNVDFPQIEPNELPTPPPPATDLEELDKEVSKRRMVNAMIQGASRKGQYLFHMGDRELSEISPHLVNLYGTIMSANEYAYFMASDQLVQLEAEGNGPKFGVAQVDYDQEAPVVQTEALIFPVLLHEMFKGMMELVASHGLPKDKDIRECVLDRADHMVGEAWDLRIGPGIWQKFVSAIDTKDGELRYRIFHKIIQLPADEFHEFIKEILLESPRVRTRMAEIGREVRRELQD